MVLQWIKSIRENVFHNNPIITSCWASSLQITWTMNSCTKLHVIHSAAAEIFQSGPKLWTNRQTVDALKICARLYFALVVFILSAGLVCVKVQGYHRLKSLNSLHIVSKRSEETLREKKWQWMIFIFPILIFTVTQCVHSGLQGSQANVSRSQCSHMSKLPSVSMTTGWTFRLAWTPVINKSCLYGMIGYKKKTTYIGQC